jgi:peptidoglycan hydrolase-like protein with peptidoglycan-binding domain
MALANTPVNGFIIAPSPRYLSFLDSGKDVGEIQFKLRSLGFLSGSCDGLFGNQTQEAVIKFQVESQLNPTGIIDRTTRNHLTS